MLVIGTGELGNGVLRAMLPKPADADIRVDLLGRSKLPRLPPVSDASSRGSTQPVFDEQLDVRALLRWQTAMRWKIVSVGMFTGFLFEPSFGIVNLERGVVRWEAGTMR